jgi:hypothetical protein
MSGEYNYDVPVAAQKLYAFEDETINPNVVEFAHFLAGRIKSDALVPIDFVMASHLAITDVERGQDGFTGQALEGQLIGLDSSQYAEMTVNIPKLAGVAVSDEFAGDVLTVMIGTGMLKPPVSETETPGDEIITEVITDIDTARRLIIDDAKRRVLELDWEHFGVDKTEVAEGFDGFGLLALRQAPYGLPINVLLDRPEHERGLLMEMMGTQKRQVEGDFWLALTQDPIDPGYATLARDHLLLKTPETLASLVTKGRVGAREAIEYFGSQDDTSTLERAAIRIATFLSENPQILK